MEDAPYHLPHKHFTYTYLFCEYAWDAMIMNMIMKWWKEYQGRHMHIWFVRFEYAWIGRLDEQVLKNTKTMHNKYLFISTLPGKVDINRFICCGRGSPFKRFPEWAKGIQRFFKSYLFFKELDCFSSYNYFP